MDDSAIRTARDARLCSGSPIIEVWRCTEFTFMVRAPGVILVATRVGVHADTAVLVAIMKTVAIQGEENIDAFIWAES